jgi:hypothetical protein
MEIAIWIVRGTARLPPSRQRARLRRAAGRRALPFGGAEWGRGWVPVVNWGGIFWEKDNYCV